MIVIVLVKSHFTKNRYHHVSRVNMPIHREVFIVPSERVKESNARPRSKSGNQETSRDFTSARFGFSYATHGQTFFFLVIVTRGRGFKIPLYTNP